jgi:hypothetical protein
MVHGSLLAGKVGISTAAAGATGGAAGVALEAGHQALELTKDKGSKQMQSADNSTETSSTGNFLQTMSSTQLALLGMGGLALMASLARGR